MPSLKVCFSIKGTLAPPFGGNINDAETKSSFPGLPEWIDLNIIVPVSATIIVVCVGILVVCVAVSRRKTPPMMNPGLVSALGYNSPTRAPGNMISLVNILSLQRSMLSSTAP